MGNEKYYRIKESSSIDPITYYWDTGVLPYEHLDEISEDQFLDGSGKTISYGVSRDKLEALVSRRKQELLAVPSQV